jgi:hypothetical protein
MESCTSSRNATPEPSTRLRGRLPRTTLGKIRSEGPNWSHRQQRRLLVRPDIDGIPNRPSNAVGVGSDASGNAGLISSPQRAYNKITDDGLNAIAQRPERIDTAFLSRTLFRTTYSNRFPPWNPMRLSSWLLICLWQWALARPATARQRQARGNRQGERVTDQDEKRRSVHHPGAARCCRA